MNSALKIAAVVALVFIGSGAVAFLIEPSVSGFVSLIFGDLQNAQKNGSKNLDEKLQINQNENSINADSGQISGNLSYEIIGLTKLDANLLFQGEIPYCPDPADIEIRVKNSGRYAAEKMGITTSQNFVVLACDGCKVERLESGKEMHANVKLCRSAGQELKISIAAVNANPIELKIGKSE